MDITLVTQQHNELVKTLIETKWYTAIYNKCLLQNTLDVNSPESICSFWNDFWYQLPDVMAIRKSPLFYKMCDLAEGDYLE